MLTRFGAGYASVLRNATLLVSSHVLSALLRGAYVIIVARALGPEAYGEFNFGLAWYLVFIALTYLGLDVFLAQQVGRSPRLAGDALYQTFLLRSTAAIAAAITSIVCAWYVVSDPNLRRLMAIFSIGLIGRALWLWAVSAFTAFERSRYALAGDAVFRPLEIVCALAVLAWRQDIQWLAVVHAALWWLQGLVGLRAVHGRLAAIRGNATLRDSLGLLAKTYPAGIYTIVTSLFMQAPIVLMQRTTSDSVYAGQFVLAYQACVYLLVLPFVAASTILPVAARSAQRQDGKDALLTGLILRLVFVLGTLLVVLGGALLPALVEALFGSRYAEAGPLLQRAIWLLVLFTAVNVLSQLFFARESYAPVGWLGMLGAAVMCMFFVPAVERWAGTGGIAAVGGGLVIWYVALLVATSGILPRFDRRGTFRAFLCSGLAAAVFALATGQGNAAQLGVTIGTLLLACLVLRVFRRDDLSTLSGILQAR